MANRPTFNQLLQNAIARLNETGVASPKLDARLLLQEASDLNHAGLISRCNDQVAEDVCIRFQKLVDRRICGEPVQRILGRWEFFGREFRLAEETLVPRPETELLIEAVLAIVPNRDQPLSILDIGTGCGAIAVTLVCEMPNAHVLATDISASALATAATNAKVHGVSDRSEFRCSDLFEEISNRFDIIVSNPPYIPSVDLGSLQTEVRNHDPQAALDGGADGLVFYRRISAQCTSHLKPEGLLGLEIGIEQADAVSQMLKQNGFSNVEVFRDLAGIDRVLLGRI